MGWLSAVLPKPQEMKDCLREIAALEAECNAKPQMFYASEAVSREARKVLEERRDEVVRRLRDGKETARVTVLFAFRKAAGNMVTSGHYHVYRGVLGLIGKGLLGIFEYT